MSLHLFIKAASGKGWGDRLSSAIRSIGCKASSRFGWVGLMLLLGACQPLSNLERAQWETYQNERYDFAFPHPDNWIPKPILGNREGREFQAPQQNQVTIQGWASQVSEVPSVSSPQPEHGMFPNFTTEQGLQGQLEVKIGKDMSNMRLTLTQNGVIYYWEGRSPSDDFDDYFKFFFYVAKQYQVGESNRTP
ncbi:hypothetical protein H6G02_08215 [Leptolyngbya sp. FACHB-16]|nr:hypothetical protein [Leptolyngbya sp. FACHB-16]